MTDPVVQLARDLIRQPSVTPDDKGCQTMIAARLETLGFHCEHLPFGDVRNLWATRGCGSPLLCFAGHTDVVPTGPDDLWHHPPFDAVIDEGRLYGRGAADMKGSLAAMVAAANAFVDARPGHAGQLAFLITSDEEGPAVDGTRRVIETLKTRGVHIDYCLVGEPSSHARIGDTLRIGRRGSLNGTLTVNGVQGHVAFPDKADNPIHRLAPALAELCATAWDNGNDEFPATSFQVSGIQAGEGAMNVIPGRLRATFNFRYSTAVTACELERRTTATLDKYGLSFDIDWQLSGLPFLTKRGILTEAVQDAVRQVAGIDAELSTGGGTSDGRFIAPMGAEVVELGPINATIHKIDEHAQVEDLAALARMYRHVMERLLPGS